MPRVSISLLLLLAFTFPVPLSAQQPSYDNLDVLYVWENLQQLVTYDIDSSGNPTQVGKPFPLGRNVYAVVPAPDDHFLYVVSGGSDSPFLISVHATNSDGVPQLKPIQTLRIPDVDSLEIGPNGRSAYAIRSYLDGQGFTVGQILLSYVNSKSGRLNKSFKLEYTSQPDGPCGTGWSEQGWMFFKGFSSDGSKLYTEWFCTALDWIEGVYFAFDVNPTTGALGHPRKVFAWAENQSADAVWFAPKAVIDVGNPGHGEGFGWVNIYPPHGGSKLIFSCTGQMLEGCGYGGVPDPTGKYIFFPTSSGGTDVGRIEITKQQIVDTGNTMPSPFLALSPDEQLVYAEASNGSSTSLIIYTFDAQTGALQQGGIILTGEISHLFPAVRE